MLSAGTVLARVASWLHVWLRVRHVVPAAYTVQVKGMWCLQRIQCRSKACGACSVYGAGQRHVVPAAYTVQVKGMWCL